MSTQILIGFVLATAAICIVLLNICLVYRKWKHGGGMSVFPGFAFILGVPAVGLFLGRETFFRWWIVMSLAVAVVDFGSWILTAYICKRDHHRLQIARWTLRDRVPVSVYATLRPRAFHKLLLERHFPPQRLKSFSRK